MAAPSAAVATGGKRSHVVAIAAVSARTARGTGVAEGPAMARLFPAPSSRFTVRVLPALVVAIGAALSVATSRVQWWLQASSAEVPVHLDAEHPVQRFRVRASIRAASMPYGSLTTSISVDALSSARLHATLTSDLDPAATSDSWQDAASPRPEGAAWLYGTPWSTCERGPCDETFTLTLELQPRGAQPASADLRISNALEGGGDGDQPRGAAVDVEMVPLP
jgi:hypothetical protein